MLDQQVDLMHFEMEKATEEGVNEGVDEGANEDGGDDAIREYELELVGLHLLLAAMLARVVKIVEVVDLQTVT